MNHDDMVVLTALLWIFVFLLPHVHSLTQLMVLGAGRVGRAVLDHAGDHFDSVWGVVRTHKHHQPNEMLWDADMERILAVANQCTHLLVTLPPDVQMERCEAIAATLPSSCWVGVISTTGVYGNYDGGWVTEESECRGRNDYLIHEATWRNMTNNSANVFRCAGIYGPQSSALHTVFRNGISDINHPVEFPTNRIHLDDIVQALVTSMRYHQTSCCYNLADDEPANRSTVMQFAAHLLESFNITLATNPATPRRQRRDDRKRVCNLRLKAQLVPHLKYPSYREGLVAILNDESCPWWQD